MKDHDETDNRENIISLKRQFLESSIVEHSNSILLFNDVKNYYFENFSCGSNFPFPMASNYKNSSSISVQ